MSKSRVMMAQNGTHAQIRVEGRGTFETAAAYKTACQQLLGRGATDFVIDLGSCEALDSTFLGIMIGSGFSIQQHAGHARVVDASPDLAATFKDVGLERLYEINETQPG